jgi:hypothetical protein
VDVYLIDEISEIFSEQASCDSDHIVQSLALDVLKWGDLSDTRFGLVNHDTPDEAPLSPAISSEAERLLGMYPANDGLNFIDLIKKAIKIAYQIRERFGAGSIESWMISDNYAALKRDAETVLRRKWGLDQNQTTYSPTGIIV